MQQIKFLIIAMKALSIFLISVIMPIMGFAQSNKGADAILGIWQTGSGKGRVQIFKGTDGHYHGKIVWLKEPHYEDGKPKIDKNNPDPARKKTPLLGLQNLRDFIFEGENLWSNGKIYDPEKGSDYSCKMTLANENTLDVRGFIGISLFGRTDTWRRILEKK